MKIYQILIVYFFCHIISSVSFANENKKIDIFSTPLKLNPIDINQKEIGKLEYISGFELNSNERFFGGLSGLSINSKMELFSVTDRGVWFKSPINLDSKGKLIEIKQFETGVLKNIYGEFIDLDKSDSDAEAIEIDENGHFLISFERNHRVLKYKDLSKTPEVIIPPTALNSLPFNGGVESFIPITQNKLFLITEDKINKNSNIEAFIFNNNKLSALELNKTGIFKPTDLSNLANGDLLLLERSFTPIMGPAARISLIEKEKIIPGQTLIPTELATIRPPLMVDNFEGIAVVGTPSEGYFIFVISDDNFKPVQRTLLMQFYWDGITEN